jgi:hypothetical protein
MLRNVCSDDCGRHRRRFAVAAGLNLVPRRRSLAGTACKKTSYARSVSQRLKQSMSACLMVSAFAAKPMANLRSQIAHWQCTKTQKLPDGRPLLGAQRTGRRLLRTLGHGLPPRIDAKPSSDLARTGPSMRRQGVTDSFFQGGGYRRPPEALSLIPDSRKGGTDSFSSHVSQSFQNPLKRSGAKAV